MVEMWFFRSAFVVIAAICAWLGVDVVLWSEGWVDWFYAGLMWSCAALCVAYVLEDMSDAR